MGGQGRSHSRESGNLLLKSMAMRCRGRDSRFRGNDARFERSSIPNDTSTDRRIAAQFKLDG